MGKVFHFLMIHDRQQNVLYRMSVRIANWRFIERRVIGGQVLLTFQKDWSISLPRREMFAPSQEGREVHEVFFGTQGLLLSHPGQPFSKERSALVYHSNVAVWERLHGKRQHLIYRILH